MAQQPPETPPPQIPAICNDDVVAIVFFEFDSAVVSTEAGQTLIGELSLLGAVSSSR